MPFKVVYVPIQPVVVAAASCRGQMSSRGPSFFFMENEISKMRYREHTVTPRLILALLMALCALGPLQASAAVNAQAGSLNKPDRLEWFRDQGLGLFIHWSLDSQLGVVISHSLVGASEDYVSRFFDELPKTFDPDRFRPRDWAVLAHLAGVRYVVFTTKHHSGFCMFDTSTTAFNVTSTPFRRDIAAEIFDAFRAEGIAAGVYFSPDDFWWLHQHGKTLQRGVPEVQPSSNPGLLAYDQAQLRELFTRYGRIDVAFFDGEADGLRELAWELQPNVVVTRSAMQTPELYVPGMPLAGAWEANNTMGTAWQYQPQNELYKSGQELIGLLIETRAKGGNLLLNVGPKPNGELPIEQEERLREIALWMFVNSEAIHSVRPWVITNEGPIWFTRKKDGSALYAIVESGAPWPRATWKDFTLHSVRANADTQVSVLGQNDQVLEYRPDVTPKSTWHQEPDGLHIHVMHAQRLQDNHRWPNPVVIKITNAAAALSPPRVTTLGSLRNPSTGKITLKGELLHMGDSQTLQVGFEYRAITGEDVHSRSGAWSQTALQVIAASRGFSIQLDDLPQGAYEFRAWVKHPLMTFYGEEKPITNGSEFQFHLSR
jgi:alpha-L-fucosidase